jgi:hypothetical protein
VKAVEHAQVNAVFYLLTASMRAHDECMAGLLEPIGESEASRAQTDKVRNVFHFRLSINSQRVYRMDDSIFENLSNKFPELVQPPYNGLRKLDEDWMKSEEGKTRWRDFVEEYKDTVKDYNFGSLIRMDASDEYGERNTIFGESLRSDNHCKPSHSKRSDSHAGMNYALPCNIVSDFSCYGTVLRCRGELIADLVIES